MSVGNPYWPESVEDAALARSMRIMANRLDAHGELLAKAAQDGDPFGLARRGREFSDVARNLRIAAEMIQPEVVA